ncbi:MAG TPA: family 20 glycosylhydrolase [Sedimentisphaerales bacterium]|nr:family 20 glycosylhydrolase [Sedimentisphaerales bacterium]
MWENNCRKVSCGIKFLKGPVILFFVLTMVFYVTVSVNAGVKTNDQEITAKQLVTSTNRPMRNRRDLVLTVGQTEGDLQGRDDKIIQAGIEYLDRLGGGTLHILPGVYNLRNAVYLRPNITLRGSGERTVLRKADSVVTALVRDSDWFEYGVQVNDVKGFTPGGGIMLRSKKGTGDWQYDVLRATVTAIHGDVLYLDQLTKENFWIDKDATAATIFPILTAENVDNVVVRDIVLDGSRDNNEHINGNFAGAVFIQYCNGWRFENVISRNYNGDGFSFQVCDDIQFQNCKAIENADLGFHPGSGSQRPVFRNCVAQANSLGIFFCWSVSDGLVENCILSRNKRYGISIGHRDTDNIIRQCTIERNGEVGVLFRKEANEFRSGSRNRIENCIIRDNGTKKQGIGIDIQGKTQDITVRNTRLENTAGKNQKIGIRIGEEAERTILQDNTFENCPVHIENLRSKMALGVVPLRAEEQSTGRLTAKSTNPQSIVHIIPHPVALEVHDGQFRFTTGTQVLAGAEAKAEAVKLLDYLMPAMGYRLSLLEDSSTVENVIKLEIESSLKEQLGEEGYQLEVTTPSIVIRAAKPAGLFYSIQTLRQLLPPAIFNKQKVEPIEWAVPCVRITDYPRFKWRGLLIDPARHFIPKQDVKSFIDAMALHKFNRLQMHLTDDQGWRIEINKYPQLTEIGAWMDFTTMRGNGSRKGAGGRHPGGFYTQDDIRELVRYAAERYVTIVPEIEMPAHTGAAIVSCPDIGLYPDKLKKLPPEKRWTANERILAPRPQTVAFMQDVLTEVMELFPGGYIHIGGDEANMDHWKKSKEMQALLLRLGLKDEAELHSWFIKQMDAFLRRHGRLLVGWDEILQGGLAQGAVVMSWRGQAGGITAAKAGHDVIMAPTSHTYFDYYQGPAKTEPKAIGGHIPLDKVYQFEPIPAALDTGQAKRVLGGQGQLWGEYIADRKHREYMTYPRAAALSEVLWSPRDGRNYELFLNRLVEHLKRLNEMDVNYRPLDR